MMTGLGGGTPLLGVERAGACVTGRDGCMPVPGRTTNTNSPFGTGAPQVKTASAAPFPTAKPGGSSNPLQKT